MHHMGCGDGGDDGALNAGLFRVVMCCALLVGGQGMGVGERKSGAAGEGGGGRKREKGGVGLERKKVAGGDLHVCFSLISRTSLSRGWRP